MTPIHRAYFGSSDKNIQPDEMYENVRGIFFDEYVKAIKEVGNVWAVPVIDLNSLSGLFPLYDAGAQFMKASKQDQGKIKDVGGYIGATLLNGSRKKSAVQNKQLITHERHHLPNTYRPLPCPMAAPPLRRPYPVSE